MSLTDTHRSQATRGACAIVGVGQTVLSKAAEDTELELALEASLEALADAGVSPDQVDGLLRFGGGFEQVSHAELIRALGIKESTYVAEAPLGGDASGAMVHHAVAALVSGRASVVLAYRSIKQSGGRRFGRADSAQRGGPPRDEDIVVRGQQAFLWPYWMMAPAHLFGLWATRYMAEYDLDKARLDEALARVALDQRAYANRRPGTLMHDRTLTREQYDNARMIAWPLCLFTICLECDGAAAVVVTTSDRAAELPTTPAPILATTQSLQAAYDPGNPFMADLTAPFPASRAEQLWSDAGVGPGDVSVAQIYDATSLMTLFGLELYGFLPRGEGWKYLAEYGIGPDSPLPINTHGGHLSDGYVQGMTGLVEAVRQFRGTAVNQVPDVSVSFFGTLSGSAVVLGPVTP